MENFCIKEIIFLGFECFLGLKVDLEGDEYFMKINWSINLEKNFVLLKYFVD